MVLTTVSFANAQPGRSVQRQRSATVNRGGFSGQLPAQPLRVPTQPRVTVPPRPVQTFPRPVTGPRVPRPVPVPVPVPVPSRLPPRYRYPAYYPYSYGLGAAAIRSRSRTVINNGVGGYSTPAQSTQGYAPQQSQAYTAAPAQSTQPYNVDPLVEQLKAENAALREENAYLKGQVQALQVK